MPILSFRHLKKQSAQQTLKPAPPAPTSAIAPAVVAQVVITPARLQRVSCIGIAKMARLAATNYCAPCPRFWPADENERKHGVAYGRCMRKSDGWVEEWRIIPVGARVYQCSYHRGDDDREIHGPAPCQTKNWKLEM